MQYKNNDFTRRNKEVIRKRDVSTEKIYNVKDFKLFKERNRVFPKWLHSKAKIQRMTSSQIKSKY